MRLGQLIAALEPDRQAVATALADILRTAADTDPEQDPAIIQHHLEQWEQVIAATVAAAGGNSDAAAQLTPLLDELAQRSDWTRLAAVLRRIMDGERGDDLLDVLGPVHTAIAIQVLTRLAQPPNPPTQEPPAV